MFFWGLMVFAGISLLELHLLITLGHWIGAANVILIVIITALIGFSFARSQGLQILARMQRAYSQGQIPGRELVEGAMVLIGGFLLIAPGLLADVLGFTLLFPPTRFLYLTWFLFYLRKKFRQGQIHVYHTQTPEPEQEEPVDLHSSEPPILPPGEQE